MAYPSHSSTVFCVLQEKYEIVKVRQLSLLFTWTKRGKFPCSKVLKLYFKSQYLRDEFSFHPALHIFINSISCSPALIYKLSPTSTVNVGLKIINNLIYCYSIASNGILNHFKCNLLFLFLYCICITPIISLIIAENPLYGNAQYSVQDSYILQFLFPSYPENKT